MSDIKACDVIIMNEPGKDGERLTLVVDVASGNGADSVPLRASIKIIGDSVRIDRGMHGAVSVPSLTEAELAAAAAGGRVRVIEVDKRGPSVTYVATYDARV